MPTQVPDLAIASGIATITNSEAGSTNVFVFAVRDTERWHALDFIIGDGTIPITGIAPGDYTGRVMSIDSPGTVSDAVDFSVSGAVSSGGINANWGRWIYASICQHFQDRKDANGTLYMFLEGTHRDDTDLQHWFELRVDGPYYQQFNKGWWDVIVEVNAVITVAKSDKDFHAIRYWTDFVASIFTNTIEIFRYGNKPSDDNTFVDCIYAQDGRRKNLQISHFGQLQPADEVLQASVERHYKTTLPEE